MSLPIPAFLRNPIFEREFVQMCRTRRWFVVRTLLVALLTIVLWIFLIFVHREMDAGDMDIIGQILFGACVFVQVGFVFAVTPALISDLIVSERRKETLDILLVSPLSATGIILGKLFSRLILIFVIVAASFPVISITLLYGGVRAGQVLGLFLVTLGTILFTAGPALLFSSFARRLGTAAVLSYIVPLALLVALPIVCLAVDGEYETSLQILSRTHVAHAAAAIAVDDLYTHLDTGALSPALGMLLTGATVCLLCTFVAIFRLRRESRSGSFGSGRPRKAKAETDLLLLRNRIVFLGRRSEDPATRQRLDSALLEVDRALALIDAPAKRSRSIAVIVRELRKRLDDLEVTGDQRVAGLTERARTGRRRWFFKRMKNPVLWKEINLVNATQSRVLFYVALLLLFGGEILFFLTVSSVDIIDSPDAHITLVTTQALLLLILVSVNSATSVIGEKEQGTLDLLRVTLITPREVVSGKVVGSLRSIAVLAFIPVFHMFLVTTVSDVTFGAALSFTGVLTVLLLFFAVHGVRASIVARSAPRAILRSMGLLGGLLIVLPIGILLMQLASGAMDDDFFQFLLISHPLALIALPPNYFAQPHRSDEELIGYAFAWLIAYLLATGFLYLTMPATFRRTMSKDD